MSEKRGCCKICGGKRLKELYTVKDHTVWQCSSCSFGQVWLSDESSLAEFYDEAYFSGEKARFAQMRSQEISPWMVFWLEHFLRKLRPSDKLRVAEIGPGPGAAIGRYLKTHHREVAYEAIEISSFAADCLREEQITTYTGLVTDTNIRTLCRSKFDLIIGTEVIEHDPNPRGFAESIYDMLKPGGQCAFTTGNLSGIAARIHGRNWYYIDPPAHLSYFSPKAATQLFKQSGFSKVHTWRVGSNYINLKLKLKIPGILLIPHLLSLPTGMTIIAERP